MKCPICNSESKKIFNGRLLKKYDVMYYQCPCCAFLHTEEPYWLEDAYSSAISQLDTGIMRRNVSNVLIVNEMIKHFFNGEGQFLDFGGGYGVFVRMMRDLGYDFKWLDKYSVNLMARGFEYQSGRCELVTAFELFEHLERPMEVIKYLFEFTDVIFITTLLYDKARDYKGIEDWWYYCIDTGQHISFYSEITFQYIANMLGLKYLKIGKGGMILHKSCIRIDSFKWRLFMNSKIGKVFAYKDWIVNRSSPQASIDMEFLRKSISNK